MSDAWAIRLAKRNAGALAELRGIEGIEVTEVADAVWVRGQHSDERLTRQLRGLPADARFAWLGERRLRPQDSRIPADRLPDSKWQPIKQWLVVELPMATLSAVPPARVPLRLERTGMERGCSLLLTELRRWTDFASIAAEVRLKPLRFAAAADGEVLIRGEPLPPLPGLRWVDYDGVAVPAGFGWQPEVDVDVLRDLMGATPEALVLWHEDGTLSRILAEQFIPATRSSLRATLGADHALAP